MYISNYRRRCKAVFLVFFILLLLCVGRLLFIQFFRANYLTAIARKQHNKLMELEPRRGTIYDCNLKAQAFNMSMDSLYAEPNIIKNKDQVAEELSAVLGPDRQYFRERLNRDKAFIWLERKLTPEKSEKVKKFGIKGLGFIKETKRIYPNSYLGSHIIGFSGMDNIGLEGIERSYDGYLRGTPGWAIFLRDARMRKLDIWEKMVLPQDGLDVVLTVDEVIQYIAERELEKAFCDFHAKGASIVVMDPYTGRILAMANRPTYDLNDRSGVNKDAMRNRAICDLFEPGSVFKIVTASAALEEKKVSENDVFFCENGAYRVGGRILHDHTSHGNLTFRQVIEESSNIGTVKVAQILGPDTLYRYIKAFGFGNKTGIDLAGEISGIIRPPRLWSKTSITAVPMGQEVGVTALQLASAISVIANGGQLMKPYIIDSIRDNQGTVIKQNKPVFVRKVISVDTAMRIKKILTGVVEEGTGRLGKVQGFSAAGKTGTAQKLEPNGSYSHNKFVASFIGFAPAEDPLLVIVVMVDEPHPSYFGGVVAAPVFKKVAGDVIRYLKGNQIPAEASR
ncbi:MAG: penicillin-binding transpeptidase domain-containing protein [Candidatus Omnitrophica bacterium]|nr:penicillin-binding protein 2 [Candidatus Omnitrophota bacterium]MDD3274148.1 penicillin-binding transpeptidase domain-containing protein [Candidatus Omnitrophota bacterium]MDD5077846.1 penicillin-binding transpeptidase domain-containing protein [Candidatus Omnitrophota bacterium]MDD5724578.1 penicillin-binding transpeptidase domain-containing protein [Candidatus Omnitrophota bacterium]